jgi:hypothetical protein
MAQRRTAHKLIESLPGSPEEFRAPEEEASSDFKNAILQL